MIREAQSLRCVLIVLNYDGAEVIRPCLDSLLRAVGASDRILVVDNASTDGSDDLIANEYPDVRLLRRATNNFIFGLNDGLAAAPPSTYVAFLNNDIVVERNFVEHSIREFTSGDIFAVCPRIIDRHGGDQGALTEGFWHRGLIFYRALPHSKVATDCFFAVGGQSFYRRRHLDEIGSIDQLLWPMYHEDIELSYRAWKRGWRIRYAPEALVHHVGGHSSSRRFSRSDLRSFVRQNEFLTVWKDVTDLSLVVQHVAWLPARLVVAIWKRDWPTLVGFGRAVRRSPSVVRARRAARVHFKLSDRDVLELVGGARQRLTERR